MSPSQRANAAPAEKPPTATRRAATSTAPTVLVPPISSDTSKRRAARRSWCSPRPRLRGHIGRYRPPHGPVSTCACRDPSAYLVSSGVWPILHRRSFERVTGRKHDFWLVRTVGGLAVAAGASLGLAAVSGRNHRETSVLALATGLVFGVADLRAARTHSRIYLGDALMQLVFAPTWLRSWGTADERGTAADPGGASADAAVPRDSVLSGSGTG